MRERPSCPLQESTPKPDFCGFLWRGPCLKEKVPFSLPVINFLTSYFDPKALIQKFLNFFSHDFKTVFLLKLLIKLCLLLWFEFFRTIALLLGALRGLIAGYSKSSSASVECMREIFSRTNFHHRVVSLGINVSSTVEDDEWRTGEGVEQCRLAERTPRHYNKDFFSSNSFVYIDRNKRVKSARRFLKFPSWDTVSSKYSSKCFFFIFSVLAFFTFIRTRDIVTS